MEKKPTKPKTIEPESRKQKSLKPKGVTPATAEQSVLVWDIPTRLFHWLLVIGVVYAWFAVEILEDMEQHFYAGYSAFFAVISSSLGFCR